MAAMTLREARTTHRIRARPALGTYVEIDARMPHGACIDDARVNDAIDAAFAAIDAVEDRMSPHRPGSDVARIACAAVGEPVAIDAMTVDVLSIARALHRASDGLFECVAGDACAKLADLAFVERLTVVKTKPLRLDLGGIAKGYAVDRAVAVLAAMGGTGGCVNAGGDLRVFGDTIRRVDLRDPRDPTRRIPLIDLHDAALATSADYFSPGALVTPWGRTARRQAFDAGASVSVRAPSALLADALTKIVALTGDAKHPLLARHGAEAIIVAPQPA